MEPSRKGSERERGVSAAAAAGTNERTKEGDHQNFFSPERLLAAAVWDSPILKRRFRRGRGGLQGDLR